MLPDDLPFALKLHIYYYVYSRHKVKATQSILLNILDILFKLFLSGLFINLLIQGYYTCIIVCPTIVI